MLARAFELLCLRCPYTPDAPASLRIGAGTLRQSIDGKYRFAPFFRVLNALSAARGPARRSFRNFHGTLCCWPRLFKCKRIGREKMQSKRQATSNGASQQKQDADDLREELETLRDDLKSLVSTAQGVLAAQAEAGTDRGKEAAKEANAKAKEARDVTEGAVRDNPLTAIGIALGIGALIGALRTK